MNPRLPALGALAVFAIVTGTASYAQTTPAPLPSTTPPPPAVGNPTAPPLLVVPGTTPTPTATDLSVPAPLPSLTPPPRGRGRGGPSRAKATPTPDASDTPEPSQFQNLDGVWEIEGQPFGQRNAVYSHLNLVQKEQTLTGTWKRDDKHTLPVSGTFDGRVFHLTATDPATKVVYTIQGYVENYMDMVGRVVTDSEKIKPLNFTGQHRKKSKLGA